jgi:hypothetical protein
MRLAPCFAAISICLFVSAAGCNNSAAGPSKQTPPACAAVTPPTDPGACVESQDCPLGDLCVQGVCQWLDACALDCQCPLGTTCNTVTGRCNRLGGTLCAQCDAACSGVDVACKSIGTERYCATACSDTHGPFCPWGYTCLGGWCGPDWAESCAGCDADSDCAGGEVCNPNSRRCQVARNGPEFSIELDATRFWFTDDDNPANSGLSTQVGMTTMFGSIPNQNFLIVDVPVGSCVREEGTFTHDAPFPAGRALDMGSAITLTLDATSYEMPAQLDDPNPLRNPTYGWPSGFLVDSWQPGVLSTWSVPGGIDVGAWSVSFRFGDDFTSTPDLLTANSIAATLGQDLTLSWAPSVNAAAYTMLGEVIYNLTSGNTVLALVQIVCRVPDSAGTLTLPGALLDEVPTGVALSLQLQRVGVGEVSAPGLDRGQISASRIHSGSVVFTP